MADEKAQETLQDASQVSAPTPDGPDSGTLQEHWSDLKEALNLPRMTDDQLRQFIDDYCSDRIFTSGQLRNNEADLIPTIFLPLSMGCFSKLKPESLSQIGCLWEHYSKAGPRSINGHPIFLTFNLMHIDDWTRALQAIDKEEQRRKEIHL